MLYLRVERHIICMHCGLEAQQKTGMGVCTLTTSFGLSTCPKPYSGAWLTCKSFKLSVMQAHHPPYDLPTAYADQAKAVFADMRKHGFMPGILHYNTLLDCQVGRRICIGPIASSIVMQGVYCEAFSVEASWAP